ncbi:MAG: D-alanyl-D-alanine carboxypeptidase [Oscillospiraceae bacterium]|nr:D-alanyl-D-alanine carboxypeptidase [Oscillospiraceae bacterium]
MCNRAVKCLINIFAAIAYIINFICINAIAEEKEYADSYVLIEANSKVVISSKNENEKVPVGTMAKLMTVLIIAENIENGTIALNDTLKTSAYANSMQGAQIWLMQGEEITVSELLKAVIIGNANDAAVVLAEAVSETEENFTTLMNDYAEKIGMKNTAFTNCNGYYNDMEQISTAYDMAILCAELAEYDFLQEYFVCWRDFVRGGETELVNANKLVKSYNGILGFKAGYTDNSGYCISVGAERNDTAYISVVLGYEDEDNSLSKAKSLLNMAFSEYTVFTPALPENIPVEISVKGGLAKTVALEYEKIRKVVLPNSAVNSVTSKIVITDYVYAPVPKGHKVGEIQYFRNNKLMFCVDIVTKENINEINITKSLDIILKKLLTF